MFVGRGLAVFVAAWLTGLPALAQSGANVTGRVVDQTGGVLQIAF
jgi:hypothetical protein